MLVTIKALLHERNKAILQAIQSLSIKEKRRILSLVRKNNMSIDNYNYITVDGFTFSEFCVAYTIC